MKKQLGKYALQSASFDAVIISVHDFAEHLVAPDLNPQAAPN